MVRLKTPMKVALGGLGRQPGWDAPCGVRTGGVRAGLGARVAHPTASGRSEGGAGRAPEGVWHRHCGLGAKTMGIRRPVNEETRWGKKERGWIWLRNVGPLKRENLTGIGKKNINLIRVSVGLWRNDSESKGE